MIRGTVTLMKVRRERKRRMNAKEVEEWKM
jgi:hypothetical protein